MPDDCGSTSPSTIWAPTRASAAVPPSRRISQATSVESGLAVVTAKEAVRTAVMPLR